MGRRSGTAGRRRPNGREGSGGGSREPTPSEPDPLDGYRQMLAAAGRQRRRLTRAELDSRRQLGADAARRDTSMSELADTYLRATSDVWEQLRQSSRAASADLVAHLLEAAREAIVALADGYEASQRQAIRQEEARRREFIDDLLNGAGDLSRRPERASHFGLQLAGVHTVTVAHVPGQDDGHVRRLEASLLERFAGTTVLIATKDGLLVCVAASSHPNAPDEFAAHVLHAPSPGGRPSIAIGRAHTGPNGVARSFQEARDALDLVARLGPGVPVVRAADLLVYQVLMRDRDAIKDLVETVLGPLRRNRNGCRPLIETLGGYFEAGNAVAAAHQLNIAVRTLTYRLQRIKELTGYNPTDPAHRFTLQAAVLGAQLLGWPGEGSKDVTV